MQHRLPDEKHLLSISITDPVQRLHLSTLRLDPIRPGLRLVPSVAWLRLIDWKCDSAFPTWMHTAQPIWLFGFACLSVWNQTRIDRIIIDFRFAAWLAQI